MVTTNQERMLGVSRQPFCGKCCGEHTKRGNTTNKRAQKRAARQAFRQSVRFDHQESTS